MKLYMMCGVPGSGKSTYAAQFAEENNCVIVSRDQIRFSMVKEDEQYFSKEKEVFNRFIHEIQDVLDKNEKNVIIDATHISRSSRDKVFRRLDMKNVEEKNVIALGSVSLNDCLFRNEQREGRLQVPETVILNMWDSMEYPTLEEFDNVIEV